MKAEHIIKDEWVQYLTDLYKQDKNVDQINTPEMTVNQGVIQEIEAALKKVKE